MINIKSCEEIVYYFKKGSFLAMTWAIGRLDFGIVEGGQYVP